MSNVFTMGAIVIQLIVMNFMLYGIYLELGKSRGKKK